MANVKNEHDQAAVFDFVDDAVRPDAVRPLAAQLGFQHFALTRIRGENEQGFPDSFIGAFVPPLEKEVRVVRPAGELDFIHA